MQCLFCASELSSDAVDCANCGATRVTQRTPAGIVVGWIGINVALICGMVWLFLFALLAFGHDVNGFPWLALILGTLSAAGLFLYSKSTMHAKWVRRGD